MRTRARPFVVCRVCQMFRQSRVIKNSQFVSASVLVVVVVLLVEGAGGGEGGVVNRDVEITNNNCGLGATTGARQHLLFYNAAAASVTPNACSLADKWTRTKICA